MNIESRASHLLIDVYCRVPLCRSTNRMSRNGPQQCFAVVSEPKSSFQSQKNEDSGAGANLRSSKTAKLNKHEERDLAQSCGLRALPGEHRGWPVAARGWPCFQHVVPI